jgi:hypothetical protein
MDRGNNGMRTAGSIPGNERTSEGTGMDSSIKRFLILPFVAILGLFFFSAPGGGGELHPQGKRYSTVTFYVA